MSLPFILSDLKEKFRAIKQSSSSNELALAHCFLNFLLKNHVCRCFLGQKIFFSKKKCNPQLELLISDFLSHHSNFYDEGAQRAQQMSKSIPPHRPHRSNRPITWVWSETDQTKNREIWVLVTKWSLIWKSVAFEMGLSGFTNLWYWSNWNMTNLWTAFKLLPEHRIKSSNQLLNPLLLTT